MLASLEVAGTRRDRSRGLLGRDGIDGADLRVLRVVHMPRWRVGLPVPRARCAIEAEAGSFARWNLRPGDRLDIKGEGDEP